MRKIFALFLSCTIICGLCGAAFANKHIVIASGNSGGTYYYIGAGMAKILTDAIPDMEVTTEATTGSPVENATFASKSPETLGMYTLDGAYAARKGDKASGFRKPIDNLGLVIGGHDLYLYFITLKSSGIKSLADAKGKRVALALKGSTVYAQVQEVLKAYGIDPQKDCKLISMSYSEMADALKDGNIDIMCTGGGVPQSAAMDVSTTKDVLFLQIDKAKRTELAKKHPYWWFTKIPANSYRGQTQPLDLFTSRACMFANLALDNDTVYKITKTLCESQAKLKALHAEGGKWSKETTKSIYKQNLFPFHPGAKKYYDEQFKK